MPLGNLFRNCAYYWSFAGTMSFFINHPLYTSPPLGRVYAGFAAALACQALNAGSHVVLARLRADGSKGYKIPHGWLVRTRWERTSAFVSDFWRRRPGFRT